MKTVTIKNVNTQEEDVSRHKDNYVDRAITKHYGKKCYFMPNHSLSIGYGTILKENSDCNVVATVCITVD